MRKSLLGYFCAGLLTGAHAEAPLAHVYDLHAASEHRPAASSSDLVSAQTARLILAQRLGLAQYHSLKGVDEHTIRQLNDFGGSPQRLFSNGHGNSGPGKLLVIVEAVQNPDHIIKPQDGISLAFRISDPPASSATSQLLEKLLFQEGHQRETSRGCMYNIGGKGGLKGGLSGHRDSRGNCGQPEHLQSSHFEGTTIDVLEAVEDVGRSLGPDEMAMFHISSLETIAQREGMNSASYAEAEAALARAIRHLAANAHDLSSTIILMPPPNRNAKRSANPYGSYEVLPKTLRTRQQKPEEPLSIPSAPNSSPFPTHMSRPSQPQTLKASTVPAGIIPACHANYEACVAATHNCTGRGTCYKKYSSTDGGKASDCFACGCVATVRENPGGSKKTTQWGGPACQKKDVSMPFLLIAGFTIVMVATVSWGVGLLFSIGQETLPSVIGAGVAGPRAQK